MLECIVMMAIRKKSDRCGESNSDIRLQQQKHHQLSAACKLWQAFSCSALVSNFILGC